MLRSVNTLPKDAKTTLCVTFRKHFVQRQRKGQGLMTSVLFICIVFCLCISIFPCAFGRISFCCTGHHIVSGLTPRWRRGYVSVCGAFPLHYMCFSIPTSLNVHVHIYLGYRNVWIFDKLIVQYHFRYACVFSFPDAMATVSQWLRHFFCVFA